MTSKARNQRVVIATATVALALGSFVGGCGQDINVSPAEEKALTKDQRME